MRLRSPNLVSGLVLWYGVLGAPLAWAAMHVVGVGAGTAACSDFGAVHPIDPNTWALVMTAAAGLLAVAALAAALVMWFATRTEDSAPPLGRMHYLATLGLILGPLFLFMILMAGLGATVLPQCVQS
jgi:hypothetical protein